MSNADAVAAGCLVTTAAIGASVAVMAFGGFVWDIGTSTGAVYGTFFAVPGLVLSAAILYGTHTLLKSAPNINKYVEALIWITSLALAVFVCFASAHLITNAIGYELTVLDSLAFATIIVVPLVGLASGTCMCVCCK